MKKGLKPHREYKRDLRNALFLVKLTKPGIMLHVKELKMDSSQV